MSHNRNFIVNITHCVVSVCMYAVVLCGCALNDVRAQDGCALNDVRVRHCVEQWHG